MGTRRREMQKSVLQNVNAISPFFRFLGFNTFYMYLTWATRYAYNLFSVTAGLDFPRMQMLYVLSLLWTYCICVLVAPSTRPWRHLLSMMSADFYLVRARVQKFLSRIQGRANIFETKSDAEDCVEIRLAVRK